MFACRLRSLTAVTTLSLAFSVPGIAQDVDVDVSDGETPVQTSQDIQQSSDSEFRSTQQIAKWVMVDQKHIVDLAKFGLRRSKTPEVRELAETIVREHLQFADRLAGLADSSTRPTWTRSADEIERDQERRVEAIRDRFDENPEARRNQDGDQRPLENLGNRLEEGVERVAERTERAFENTRDAVRRELNDDDRNNDDRNDDDRNDDDRRAGDSVAWLDVHRDIANEVAKNAQRELEGDQGYEFDASFVGMLSAAHIQQEATLAVLSDRASGELASTLDEALQTIRQHKQHAERVMQTIKP